MTCMASVNWISSSDQRVYFDLYKNPQNDGINFKQFQLFLQNVIYDELETKYLNKTNYDITEKTSQVKFSQQQEMRLFRIFDTNNDHLIDFNEFSKTLCKHWLQKIYKKTTALTIVDVQNDFIDGSLAIINGPANQDGADVIPVINSIIDTYTFDAIVYTHDWHPKDHIGFYDNLHMRKHRLKSSSCINHIDYSKRMTYNNTKVEDPIQSNKQNTVTYDVTSTNDENSGQTFCHQFKKLATSNAQMFDTVIFEDEQMEQKLWPVHCVINSWGAQLHPKLKVVPNAIKIYKGTLSNLDAYSAFWDNKRVNETGLRQELMSRQINDVYVCGVALDYCVAASAIDSARSGFLTVIIEDACRGIDEKDMQRCKENMLDAGVILTNSRMLTSLLPLNTFSEDVCHKNNNSNNRNNNVNNVSNCLSIYREQVLKLELDIIYQRALIYEDCQKFDE